MVVPVLAADQKAAVPVAESDWSGGAHVVVGVDTLDTQLNLLPNAATDWIIRSYGEYFYLIGRFNLDNIARFHIDKPTSPLYQESVEPARQLPTASAAATSNPQDLIFVNAEKAYMPMYELTSCWIMNPQTGKPTGSIDLSAYVGSDGYAEMTTGVIVGNKLFLLMQNLERGSRYLPDKTIDATNNPDGNGYLVVIDITTDQEIDTSGHTLKGIQLPGVNPTSIQYHPESDTIFVACTGIYPSSWGTPEPGIYDGGIVTVNPNTYATALLVDDGDETTHTYGNFTGVSVISPTKGYFIGYAGWGDNSLYSFNPTTGAVTATTAPELNNTNLSPMDVGLALDKNDKLWISIGGDSTDAYSGNIAIVNTSTDAVEDKVDTVLNPSVIAFCPQTIMPGSNKANSGSGTGLISFATNAGTFETMAGTPEEDYNAVPNKPAGLTFVDGLASFEIIGLNNGDTVQVTLSWPSTPGADGAYYGIDNMPQFYEFQAANLTRNGTITTLTLVDGGYGDSDGVENGTITHTGGWAWTPPSEGGGGDGGGGGCFIGTVGSWF